MKTLVILTPGFPTDEHDTLCLPIVQQFALSLKKQYPHLSFVFVSFQYPYQKKEYLWNGIRTISMGGRNRSGSVRVLTWLRVLGTLRRLRKQHQLIGVLSLWLSECALVGKLFSKRHHLPHYTWVLGQDARKENRYISLIKPKGTEVIAVSDFSKDELNKHHGVSPFMVVPNGINPSAFPSLNTGERQIDIIGAGWLSPLKNYSLFIEVVHELQKTFPDLKACIVGEGEEDALLRQKVASLGLNNTITFAGGISHTKLFSLMNQAKIFMHTSGYEGNSAVLIEALHSGCQVISTHPLSEGGIRNLQLAKTKNEFITAATELLKMPRRSERVTFNTMDASAKKIMELFLNPL